jgi:hypothetical protein
MDRRLCWALDWGWVGAVTGGLAPVPASILTIGLPEGYFWTAAGLGATSGAAIGAGLDAIYQVLPARSRWAVLSVLAPLPLGAWGAGVSTLAAWLVTPHMVEFAPLLGSFSALLQMLWFVPVYTALAGRGARLVPVALSTLMAPVCGTLALIGFLSLFDAIRGW